MQGQRLQLSFPHSEGTHGSFIFLPNKIEVLDTRHTRLFTTLT